MEAAPIQVSPRTRPLPERPNGGRPIQWVNVTALVAGMARPHRPGGALPSRLGLDTER